MRDEIVLHEQVIWAGGSGWVRRGVDISFYGLYKCLVTDLFLVFLEPSVGA